MSRTTSPHRRQFIAELGSVSAAAAGLTYSAPSARGASSAVDRIRLGFIGLGGRGRQLLGGFLDRSDVDVAAICDVYEPHRQMALHMARSAGQQPEDTSDLQDVLRDNAVDAVVIATPDHWHSLITIEACRAGKHVYVEKPISNNIWEGRQAINAARESQRVVQSGMQNRSAPYNLKARDYIQSGKLGDVLLCGVYNQKNLPALRLAANSSVPSDLDWNLWLGPRAMRPYNASQFASWRLFWDFGGGEVTNDGVHQLDLAAMVLGIESLPKSVYALGRRRADTAAETPDVMVTTYEYDRFPLTFHQTLRHNYMLKSDAGIRNNDLFPYWPQNSTRIEIFGTKGVMFLGRHGGGWQVFDRPKSRKPVVVAQEYGRFPDIEHKQDFIESIRSDGHPNGDIEHGHRSAALCHLANISYRLGNERLLVEPKTEKITNIQAANALLRQDYREQFSIPAP